jgi:hypothetical protein
MQVKKIPRWCQRRDTSPGCVTVMIATHILKANSFCISPISNLRHVRGHTVVSVVHCRYSDHSEGISVSTIRENGTEQSHRGGARRQVMSIGHPRVRIAGFRGSQKKLSMAHLSGADQSVHSGARIIQSVNHSKLRGKWIRTIWELRVDSTPVKERTNLAVSTITAKNSKREKVLFNWPSHFAIRLFADSRVNRL